jgi:hypothetical protein
MNSQQIVATQQLEAGEQPGGHFNALCSLCEGIFARAKLGHCVFSWFHNITEWHDSAGRGYHFCNIALSRCGLSDIQSLQREMAEVQDLNSGALDKHLKAETRYYDNKGVSFLLRRNDGREHDVLVHVDLGFSAAPRKCSRPKNSVLKISPL